MSSLLKKYLSEIAIGISMLAIGGWLHFIVDWGRVQYAIAQTQNEIDTHVTDTAAHTRTETVGAQRDRLDRIEGRLDRMETEQRSVNEKMLQSLGRIEGQLK